jgi:hypothetical protein
MKICKNCNIELELYKPTSGPYYICVKCNDVTYPLNVTNMGNTSLIDEEWDEMNEIDKVVDRGRD